MDKICHVLRCAILNFSDSKVLCAKSFLQDFRICRRTRFNVPSFDACEPLFHWHSTRLQVQSKERAWKEKAWQQVLRKVSLRILESRWPMIIAYKCHLFLIYIDCTDLPFFHKINKLVEQTPHLYTTTFFDFRPGADVYLQHEPYFHLASPLQRYIDILGMRALKSQLGWTPSCDHMFLLLCQRETKGEDNDISVGKMRNILNSKMLVVLCEKWICLNKPRKRTADRPIWSNWAAGC